MRGAGGAVGGTGVAAAARGAGTAVGGDGGAGAAAAGNCTRRFAPQRVHLMVLGPAVTDADSFVPHDPHVTVVITASKVEVPVLIAAALLRRRNISPERFIGSPRARSERPCASREPSCAWA